jgi:hypothetical protein
LPRSTNHAEDLTSYARDTAIIPIGAHAAEEMMNWSRAYSTESRWLDEDLAEASMPRFREFVAQIERSS